MAKLYFYYSSMNAGKSTSLLQSSYNYRERGMRTLLFTPQLDDRYGEGKITSRIGLQREAAKFTKDTDLFVHVRRQHREAPVHCVLVDMRKEELAQCQARVDMRLRAIPEVEIYNAPAGSAFIVLTHDHGLDFLLTSAALEIGHASYVGMIGSATKRAKLRSWCNSHCNGLSIDQLTSPIGATASRDKRPEIIAAFVAAEVLTALTSGARAAGDTEEAALLEAAQ